jgi:hypothetical protein
MGLLLLGRDVPLTWAAGRVASPVRAAGWPAATVSRVSELRFSTVHEDLLAAFPELRAPYRRLFEDWDNYGGEPPGQYIVFPDTYGKMLEVALTLPHGTPGRADVLQRALSFGEGMLSATDDAVRSLGIDALAVTLDGHPAGRDTASCFGGESLRAWFAAFSRSDWARQTPQEIIDLWGVREAISPLFSATPAHELPGISYPASAPELDSLAAARATSDGVVLLACYGTSRPYLVVRAQTVQTTQDALDRLARQLADRLGGDHPTGQPSAHYLRIPAGERVWNMHDGDNRHARLWDQLWIAHELGRLRQRILTAVQGETEDLN